MTRVSTRGFTLVEITVVVALIAILLAAGAKIATGLVEGAATSVTQRKQLAIRDALINYLGRNRRLPCPDTATGVDGPAVTPPGFTTALPPDGRENRVNPVAGTLDATQDCASSFGIVPYSELGLPRDAALDGWQNYFSYHVAFGVAGDYRWNKTASYTDTATGTIPVNDRDSAGAIFELTQATDRAVVVVVSHGRDGGGAFTAAGTRNALPAGADELANTVGAGWVVPGAYFSRNPTDQAGAAGGPFNDVVMFIRGSELAGAIIRNNQVRPQIVEAQERLATARMTILGYMVRQVPGGCGVPANWAAILGVGPPVPQVPQDPWGNPLVYTRGENPPGSGTPILQIRGTTPPGNVVAFTIASPGPDDVLATPDDVAVAVTADEIRGFLGGVPFATTCN